VDRSSLASQTVTPPGDVHLFLPDGMPTYTLASAIDDDRDGVTEIVRGGDLLPHTGAQVELTRALGLEPPTFLHVPTLLGQEDGKKLAKSHGSTEIRSLRDQRGWGPRDVWRLLLPLLGIRGSEGRLVPDALRPEMIRGGEIFVSSEGAIVGGGGGGGGDYLKKQTQHLF
jgi:hypothetical protein